MPGSYASVFTSKCSVSMFRQRGVFGHRCGNSSFVPSLGILTTNFTLNCSFVIPRKGYFIPFELFLSPKGWEFNQKMCTKDKCLTYTFSLPPSLHPNIEHNLHKTVSVMCKLYWSRLTWLSSSNIDYYFFIYNGKIFFLGPFSNEKWLWACRRFRQTA